MAEIAGLKLIVPSSIANSNGSASVSASGKVTFTTVDSVSLNGVFSASYDNYLVVLRGQVSVDNRDLRFYLRASGSDATASNYTWQRIVANNTTVSGVRVSSTNEARITTWSNSANNGAHWYLYGPNLAQPTATRGVGACGSGPQIFDYALTHSLSTAYDGFSLLGDGATLTGICTVYGLAQ